MYFDPDWIFEQKPDKHQYPNITGLMDDTPKPPKKPKKKEVIESLADVFSIKNSKHYVPPETFGRGDGASGYNPTPLSRPPMMQSPPIPTQPPPVPDYLDTVESPGSTLDMQRDQFAEEFIQLIGRNPKWLLHYRPGLLANPQHQQNYYGRQIGKQYTGDVITLSDPKYNIRQGLKVPVEVIGELQKYAQAGGLTPEQTLLLAAISSNEDEFGTTRGMFGINNLYEDFPGGIRQLPGSYEAKKLMEYYSGDPYKDVIGWLQRTTNNFSEIERMNSGFQYDRNVNPRGETYTDRIMRNAEILMSNPEFMQALFKGQVPQLDLSQFKSK